MPDLGSLCGVGVGGKGGGKVPRGKVKGGDEEDGREGGGDKCERGR